MIKAGAYQTVNNLKFIYGTGSLQLLVEEMDSRRLKRAFLVTSQSITKTPYIKKIEELLGDRLAGIYANCKQNTPLYTVNEALAAFLEVNADCLIGLGGGSAIDTVKGIVLKNKNNDLELFKGLAKKKEGHLKINLAQDLDTTRKDIPIFQIPTTLSGAEFTLQAGLTDEKTGRKDQYYDRAILADCVIMDPALAHFTPYLLFASTGIKALDHNIERLYARNSQPLSDSIALQAIKMLFEYLPKYKQDPQDSSTLNALQYAAWLSQFTYGNVNVGIGHAIAHQLCALYDVAHGIAACIMLPRAMEYNKKEADEKLRMLARYVGLEDQSAEGAIRGVSDLIAGLGLPTKLRELNVRRDQFSIIAERSLSDTALVGNPREVAGPEDVMAILEAAW